MASIDAVADDLDGMATGLARAQQDAAAADHAAEQISGRAAASGFLGVAQNMGRVREAIRQIRASIGTIGQAVTELRTRVADAPKQPSPQETIDVLSPVGERLNTAHHAIGASIEKINQAKALVGAVLQGGQPGPMLARLDTIRQILIAAAQRGTMAKQNVSAALVQARKTGDQGN